MNDTLDFQSALGNFIGTEHYYFNPLYKWMKYTDGVKFFAENAGGGAYWLLDIIGTETKKLLDQVGFLSIELEVNDGKAQLRITDGDYKPMMSKAIGFTDCPAGTWKFFLVDSVLMLSSEY